MTLRGADWLNCSARRMIADTIAISGLTHTRLCRAPTHLITNRPARAKVSAYLWHPRSNARKRFVNSLRAVGGSVLRWGQSRARGLWSNPVGRSACRGRLERLQVARRREQPDAVMGSGLAGCRRERAGGEQVSKARTSAPRSVAQTTIFQESGRAPDRFLLSGVSGPSGAHSAPRARNGIGPEHTIRYPLRRQPSRMRLGHLVRGAMV